MKVYRYKDGEIDQIENATLEDRDGARYAVSPLGLIALDKDFLVRWAINTETDEMNRRIETRANIEREIFSRRLRILALKNI